MAVKISVANQKGGIGKTTTTLEIATLLASMGKRVLATSFDQQMNFEKYLQIDPTDKQYKGRGLFNVLNAECSIEEALVKIRDNLDIIIATPELSKAPALFTSSEDIFLLQDVFETVDKKYDYIIVDNSPARDVLQTMSHVACDYEIIPTIYDKGSREGIVSIYQDILKLREGRRPCTDIKVLAIVMTMFDNRTIVQQTSLEEIQDIAEQMTEKPFVMPIRASVVVGECKEFALSINEYKSNSTSAKDYKEFVEKIISIVEGRNGK